MNENEKERLRRILSVPAERPSSKARKKTVSEKPEKPGKHRRFSRRHVVYLALIVVLSCVGLAGALKFMNRANSGPAHARPKTSADEPAAGKHSFFRCLDAHPGDAGTCVRDRRKTTSSDTVDAWLKEYAAARSGQDEKPKLADMEKLCSLAPEEEKPRREYLVDKRSIHSAGEDKHKVKLARVTGKDVSVLTVIADCGAERLSYGCIKVYDAGVNNVVSKSKECDSGYFGMFRDPLDDDSEVISAFCQRYAGK